MPRSQHAHSARPLVRRPPRPQTGALPKNRFGGLSGLLDHVTLNPHDGPRPDDNHVYVWIQVAAGPFGGRYECAFNTESNQAGSRTEFAVVEEPIALGDFPTPGFSDADMSYRGLGLTQTDFRPVENGALRSQVIESARTCNRITAYGVTYPHGDGLHEIHMNSGEPAGSTHSNRVNEDGAMVFYFRNDSGAPFRRWFFIKFSTQSLE